MITGSSFSDSAALALSEAQVAALQAVADAFSVPTMGTTSSSALPVKVSPVSGEADGNKRYVEFPEAPRTPGPNPLVHAAAIAAGARIASPEVAASLIKAVRSRTAIHIKSGSSMSKLPVRVGDSLSANSPGPPQHPNIQYLRQAGEQQLPPMPLGTTSHVGMADSQLVTAMDEQMNARAMAELEAAAAHGHLVQHRHAANQQQRRRHTGSARG